MRRLFPISGNIAALLPTRRQALTVAAVTLLLSLLLHALSRTPFAMVFGRVGFVGAALLLAYSLASGFRSRWIRVLAVALMAPLAILATVVLSQGSNLVAYLSKTETLLGHFMMLFLALSIGITMAVVALRAERKERERADRLQMELEKNTLERELLNTRLRLLQAQIEPHFLFNTLANIEALVSAGSDNAGPVLRHLIAYLRAAMPRLNDADATLGAELQLVRAYLELMRMRMPDRLRFDVADLAHMASMRFPTMALLTLTENAVRHGIDPSLGGGSIAVGGQLAEGKAVVWVSDTGVGMSETAQPGTGLANLRTRLQAFYGPGAHLDLHEETPHGLRVELHFTLGATA